MVARSTRFPISGSSSRPSAFRCSDFSSRSAASRLNPCSMVARHTRFLTLVSRIRPLACWPPSQPSSAFHPHHGLPILMLLGRTTHAVTDICSSVRPFTFQQLSSPSHDFFPHHGLPFSMLLGCTSHAVPDIGSSLRPFAFRQLDHHPTPSFTHAFILPDPPSRMRSSRPTPAPPAPRCFASVPLP
jgi:hypothetical protein